MTLYSDKKNRTYGWSGVTQTIEKATIKMDNVPILVNVSSFTIIFNDMVDSGSDRVSLHGSQLHMGV